MLALTDPVHHHTAPCLYGVNCTCWYVSCLRHGILYNVEYSTKPTFYSGETGVVVLPFLLDVLQLPPYHTLAPVRWFLFAVEK